MGAKSCRAGVTVTVMVLGGDIGYGRKPETTQNEGLEKQKARNLALTGHSLGNGVVSILFQCKDVHGIFPPSLPFQRRRAIPEKRKQWTQTRFPLPVDAGSSRGHLTVIPSGADNGGNWQ